MHGEALDVFVEFLAVTPARASTGVKAWSKLHKLQVQQSHRLQHAMRGALMLLLAMRRAHAFARRRSGGAAAHHASREAGIGGLGHGRLPLVAGDVHVVRDAVGPVRGDLNGRGEGVIGVRSGSDVIRLFPDALRVLQEFHDGEHDPTKLAVASSADTPFAAAIAQAALDILEIVPGVTLREVLCRGHPEGLVDGSHPVVRSGTDAAAVVR